MRPLVIQWSAIAFIAVTVTVLTVVVTKETSHHVVAHLQEQLPEFNIRRFMAEGAYYEEIAYDEYHKDLFPLSDVDYRGFFCAIIGLMIAAGGGIGGGGILVPIYILVMGFTPKHAIPLSNITVFGGSLANTYLNSKKRHPLADRPLVDWDLILIMEPLTIAGALVGAFLNKLLREEVLAVMLVLLLSFTAYNTLKKAMKMYRVESALLSEQILQSNSESELSIIASGEEVKDQIEAEDSLLEGNEYDEFVDEPNDPSEELAKILEEEKTYPIGNINLLIIMFVVVLFINIMKGGGAFPSPLGIECGSKSFWAANFLMLGWILMISLMARSYLLNRYELKERCGYQ